MLLSKLHSPLSPIVHANPEPQQTLLKEGRLADNPVLSEPMVMSVLLSQQKCIMKIEYKLKELYWEKAHKDEK